MYNLGELGTVMNDCAALAKLPKEGVGYWTPNPKYERKDSVKIALGICKAAEMMMTLMELGIKCLKTILAVEAPFARAAITYSCFLKVKTWPLTSLAIPTQ